MEVLTKCEVLVSIAEAKELLNEIQNESSDKESQRPWIAQEMTKQVLQYIENVSICNVTTEEVANLYQQLQAFEPLPDQDGLKHTELFNIANLRPTSIVEMFAIIDHAEVRFGDEKLEQMLDLIQSTLSAPPEREEGEAAEDEEDVES
mmetsp:Transcript_4047/g.9749  ORF Transcript_4047/g.9749 Transcript_4047/m.9749 type:complete len:148 (-) Transcript_4047:241-684(-)|eukprot:CAMPEP_0177711890 /NCGR_PEP_ID=MMETSP0484_2-20121128/12103_1 /TAXON_ID=354590 /ORGANISM="Rhodomonas lens, Strain RHODO" /LENGTH=147 /DNA_ID=CAMNT_0019223655 /DNA_START=101 /DNA_END=544 /DNA_ORIENTATION=+